MVIEALNDFRACFQGIGFGDQVQFFRKEALAKVGGYPGILLMEDVELSLRLQKLGDLVLLDAPACVSGRQWSKDGLLRRVWKVLFCMAFFRWQRFCGRDASKYLYDYYYMYCK